MRCYLLLAAVALLFPAGIFGQSLQSHCNVLHDPSEDCSQALLGTVSTLQDHTPSGEQLLDSMLLLHTFLSQQFVQRPTILDSGNTPTQPEKPRFHWGRALTESFTFLVIEQAYVVHTDFRWVVSENGIPFNHFWRDYKQSLSEWTQSGWDDGDPVGLATLDIRFRAL